MNALTLVMYRREELASVSGDHCAAVLLQAIRFWSSGGAVWVDKTQPEIVAEIDGMFGINRVAAALKRLVMAGLIERRKNPYQRQLQAYQYRAIPAEEIAPEPDIEQPKDEPQAPAPEPERESEEPTTHERKVFNPINQEVQSLNLKIEPHEIQVSSLYESESELDWGSESSPRMREGDEPTQGDDDDDCPENIKQEIERIKAQIGAGRVRDVLTRCENAKARTWVYILKALRNERDQKRPSPSSALPPPSPHDYTSGPYAAWILS